MTQAPNITVCHDGAIELSQAVDEFLTDLRLKGRAKGTVSNHRITLDSLRSWCRERGLDWSALGRKELSAFARSYVNRGPSHRSNVFCTLRTFYRWAVDEGYLASSPAVHLKSVIKPSPMPRALTLAQVRELIAYLALGNGLRARRDEALMLAGLYSGLRAKELAGLAWSHIDFDARVINIRLSKMGHGRSVPLHPELRALLLRWRICQALDGDGPVFSLSRVPIKANRVSKVARIVRAATALPLTAHILRHTFATWALRGSRNVYAVSKALGHRQLKQTEIYVSADIEDIRHVVEILPAMGNW